MSPIGTGFTAISGKGRLSAFFLLIFLTGCVNPNYNIVQPCKAVDGSYSEECVIQIAVAHSDPTICKVLYAGISGYCSEQYFLRKDTPESCMVLSPGIKENCQHYFAMKAECEKEVDKMLCLAKYAKSVNRPDFCGYAQEESERCQKMYEEI